MIHEHDFSPITLNGQNHFVICVNCKTCYCTICGRAFVNNKDVAAVSAEHSFGKCIEKASRDHQPTPSLQHRVDQEE
jgi:hypothetical protein